MRTLTKWLAILLCLFMGYGTAFAGASNDPPTTNKAVKERVLLLHGLFGSGGMILGGPYFPDLPDWLYRMTGHYPVIPDLGKYSLGAQYENAIMAMEASCPDCRWHLLGHSRGGLVARMVMERHPEKIISITTVGSPHRGCPICDMVSSDPRLQAFLKTFDQAETDQILEMSQRYMEDFNYRNPHGVSDGIKLCTQFRRSPDQYYRSMLKVKGHDIYAASFVGQLTGSASEEALSFMYNMLDPTFYGNKTLGAATQGNLHYSEETDGVVPTCSAGFGLTGREGYLTNATDHNDLIYQLLGMANPNAYEMMKAYLLWLWFNTD